MSGWSTLKLLRKRARQAGVVTCYGVFGIGGTYLSLVHMPYLRRRASSEAQAVEQCQAALARGFAWFSDLMRKMRLINFDARDYRNTLPPGPCVIVANHPSIIDVIHLTAVHPKTVSVVSDRYFRNPALRGILEACNHICAGGPEDSIAPVLDEAVQRIREGNSILIFPEGTRSPMRGMHPWARGAFEIASRAQVPVVPFVIVCDPPALKRGMPFGQHPDAFVEYRLTQLRPITVGTGRAAVREAARLVERMVNERLGFQESIQDVEGLYEPV